MVNIVSCDEPRYRGMERSLQIPFKSLLKKKKISRKEAKKIIDEQCRCDSIIFENDNDEYILQEITPFYIDLIRNGVKCEMICASEFLMNEMIGCKLEYLGVDVIFDGGLSVLLYCRSRLESHLNENGLLDSLDIYNHLKNHLTNLVGGEELYPFYVYQIQIN